MDGARSSDTDVLTSTSDSNAGSRALGLQALKQSHADDRGSTQDA